MIAHTGTIGGKEIAMAVLTAPILLSLLLGCLPLLIPCLIGQCGKSLYCKLIKGTVKQASEKLVAG